MKKPTGTQIETLIRTLDIAVYRVKRLNCANADEGFLVPQEGYTVGSMQVCGASGTLSTGVVSLIVSNDPGLNEYAAHPTSTTLSAPGVTAGVAMEHVGVGAAVTTAQAGVFVDVYVLLKRVNT